MPGFRSILLGTNNTLYTVTPSVPVVVVTPPDIGNGPVQDGDLLYIFIQNRFEGATLFPLPPAGWTNITGVSSGRSRFQIWSRIAASQGASTSVPMRLGSNGYYSWGMAAYSNPIGTAANAGTIGPATNNDAGTVDLTLAASGNVTPSQRIVYVASNNWTGVPGNPDYTVPTDLLTPAVAGPTFRAGVFADAGAFMSPDQVHKFWVWDELWPPGTNLPARTFSGFQPSTTSAGGNADSAYSAAHSVATEVPVGVSQGAFGFVESAPGFMST